MYVDPNMFLQVSLLYGRVVVALTHSPYPFSILFSKKSNFGLCHVNGRAMGRNWKKKAGLVITENR